MESRNEYTAVPLEIRRKIQISVATSSPTFNVQSFIDELERRFGDIVDDVRHLKLPYNDIDSYSLRGRNVDVMILCHSINNRRFAITDVPDALYNIFLPHACRMLGRARICVLVHDFPAEHLSGDAKYNAEYQAFESRQQTTFANAALVMMGGKLDDSVELGEGRWDELTKFLDEVRVAQPPPTQDCYQIARAFLVRAGSCLVDMVEVLRGATWACMVALYNAVTR